MLYLAAFFLSCKTCLVLVLKVAVVSQEVFADGTSSRSHTAVYLEEDVAISYGMKHEHCKKYELRRIIFYDGSHSSGGHYTCAERIQLGSCYGKNDSWRYLDSRTRGGLPAPAVHGAWTGRG